MLSFLKNLFAQPAQPAQPSQATPAPPPPGSKPDFTLAFDRLVGHEGKFTDHRNDKGNWTGGRVGVGVLKGTKFGISAMTYPDLDIKNLTLDQAKAIYFRDFWLRAGADQYDGAIGYQVFDAAVNHGIGNAVRMLQRAVRVADDGDVGPLTLKAVQAMSVTDVLMRFNAQRIRFYTRLSTWSDFGRGWMNRVAGSLDYGADDA
ncbi:MAG: secretion activator protein [Alcaligenaceae bacterium]|nr:secretion activator protein [Alcaligenaceae bacterium]